MLIVQGLLPARNERKKRVFNSSDTSTHWCFVKTDMCKKTLGHNHFEKFRNLQNSYKIILEEEPPIFFRTLFFLGSMQLACFWKSQYTKKASLVHPSFGSIQYLPVEHNVNEINMNEGKRTKVMWEKLSSELNAGPCNVITGHFIILPVCYAVYNQCYKRNDRFLRPVQPPRGDHHCWR